jgi:thiol-disulfide isomerase/thioredoxin
VTSCTKITIGTPENDYHKIKNVQEAFSTYAPEYDYKNIGKKYVVVNFIEYYCLPCFEELPILEDIKTKTNNSDTEYLAFYTEEYEKLSNKLKDKNFSYRLEKANDDLRNSLCNIYREQKDKFVEECYLPSTFLIDVKSGKILYAALGKMESNKEFIKLIK